MRTLRKKTNIALADGTCCIMNAVKCYPTTNHAEIDNNIIWRSAQPGDGTHIMKLRKSRFGVDLSPTQLSNIIEVSLNTVAEDSDTGEIVAMAVIFPHLTLPNSQEVISYLCEVCRAPNSIYKNLGKQCVERLVGKWRRECVDRPLILHVHNRREAEAKKLLAFYQEIGFEYTKACRGYLEMQLR